MKSSVRTLTAVGMICLAGTFVGCQNGEKNGDSATSQPAMGMMNDSCPMMPSHAAKESVTVSYKGQTIGFCCEMCVGSWNDLSDAEKAEKVAMMKDN